MSQTKPKCCSCDDDDGERGWYVTGARSCRLGQTMAGRTDGVNDKTPTQASEAEQCIKRIQSHKGVKRVFVINSRGQTIRSSLNDPEEERRYAGLISELTKKTQSMVRELDPEVRCCPLPCSPPPDSHH